MNEDCNAARVPNDDGTNFAFFKKATLSIFRNTPSKSSQNAKLTPDDPFPAVSYRFFQEGRLNFQHIQALQISLIFQHIQALTVAKYTDLAQLFKRSLKFSPISKKIRSPWITETHLIWLKFHRISAQIGQMAASHFWKFAEKFIISSSIHHFWKCTKAHRKLWYHRSRPAQWASRPAVQRFPLLGFKEWRLFFFWKNQRNSRRRLDFSLHLRKSSRSLSSRTL